MSGTATDTRPLQTIPGIGPSMAIDLVDLGVDRVPDLVGRDPRKMYEDLCALRDAHMDRCVLYVFRCAVYFAESAATEGISPEPALLEWWHWKNRVHPNERTVNQEDC